MAYTFKQEAMPLVKYAIKCPYKMEPKFITVHNTSNDASAENEIAYMLRNNNVVSYHVAIDDKDVIQAIPFSQNAWHCGDGGATNSGNRTSIGIEICYSKGGGKRYEQAEENAVQYIAKLLKEYGWGIDRVKKHQDWSGKYCPHRILDEGRWQSFLQRIEDALNDKAEVAFKGGEEELTFSSPTLKEIYDVRSVSPGTAKLLVEKAVSVLNYDKTWLDKLGRKEITEGDKATMAYELAVYYAKQSNK